LPYGCALIIGVVLGEQHWIYKMRFFVLAIGISSLTLCLGACQTDQQAAAEVRPVTQTPCQVVLEALSSPYMNPDTKAVAMEVGRNKGCFGQPQPQTVLVR